jgi:hypothetical protein
VKAKNESKNSIHNSNTFVYNTELKRTSIDKGYSNTNNNYGIGPLPLGVKKEQNNSMVGQNGGSFNTKLKNYKKPQLGQQENPYCSPVNPNHYCSDAGLGYMGYNRDNCFYGSLAGDKENHIGTGGFMGSDFGGKENEISLSEIRHSTRTPFDTELCNREKVSFTTYNDGQSQAGRKGSKKGKKLFEDGSEMKRTGHLIGSVSYINSPLGSPSPKNRRPQKPNET